MRLLETSFWKNLWRESGLGEGDGLNCMFEGIICEHVSINLNDWRCCCAAVCECLCLKHSACCLRGAPFKSPVGCFTDTAEGEYCRLTLPCCDCALIRPRLLCGRASQFLCLYNTGALPPCGDNNEYLPQPVCAYYFVSCWPRPGCCVPPPRSKALQKLLHPGVEHIEVSGDDDDDDSLPPNSERMDRYKRERKFSDDGILLV